MSRPTHHASAVSLAGRGVLIRGASGAGKSTLALDLIEETRRDGLDARLVGDDRVHLDVDGGRLVVTAVAALFGLVEIRGLGLARTEAVERATVDLVVDLVEDPVDRMPPPKERRVVVEGVAIAAVRVRVHTARAARIVRAALGIGSIRTLEF